MSTTVDNRVVKMTFDNKSFEKGVDDTLKTIDKLNKKLEFKNASEGFDKIEEAANQVNFKKLEDNIQTLTDRFSGLGIIGMTIWTKIGDAAWDMITGPFRKVESAISNTINSIESKIVQGGWNRALNLDKAENMIKNLGYAWDSTGTEMAKVWDINNKKWKESTNIYKYVDQAVSGTAYSLDEAAVATGNLLPTLTKLGNIGPQVTDTLKAIMGVASTYSKDFNQISTYFQKVATKGSLGRDVASYMTQIGIEVYDTMQQYLGLSSEQLDEALEDGLISFEMFRDAYLDKFGESLDKANDTYEGAISNMNSAFGRVGAKFTIPLVDFLIQGANAVRVFTNAVNKELQPFINFAIESFGAFGDKLLRTFVTFATGKDDVERVSGLTEKGAKFAIYFAKAFENVRLVLTSVFKIFGMIGEAFSRVFLKNGSGIGKLLDKIYVSLNKFIKMLEKNHDFIVDGLSGIFYLIKAVLSVVKLLLPIALKVVGTVLKIATALVLLIGKIITIIAESKAFKKFIEIINKALNTISKTIKSVVNRISSFVKSLDLGNKALIILEKTWKALSSSFKIVWDVVKKVFDYAVEGIKEFNDKYHPLDVALNGIKKAFEFIRDAVKDAIDKVSEFTGIKIHIPTLKEIQEKFEKLGQKISWAFNNPKEAADNFIDKLKEIKDYLEQVFDPVVDAIQKKFEQFKSWLDGFTDGFGKARKSMEDFSESDGLEKTEEKVTILERLGDAMDKFAKGLEFVWETFKTIGKYIVQGFYWAFEQLQDVLDIHDFGDFIKLMKDLVSMELGLALAKNAYGIGEFFGTLAKSMKEGMGKNISTLKLLPEALLKISAALFVMATAVAVIGALKPESIEQAKEVLGYLAGLGIVMSLLMTKLGALNKTTKSAVEIVEGENGKEIKVDSSFTDKLISNIAGKIGTAAEIAAAAAVIRAIGYSILELGAAVALVSLAVQDFDGNVNNEALNAGLKGVGASLGLLAAGVVVILKSCKQITEIGKSKAFLEVFKDASAGAAGVTASKEAADKVTTKTPAGTILATAGLIFSLASAATVLSLAVGLIGQLDLDDLGTGLLVIGGIIAFLTAAIILMNKFMLMQSKTGDPRKILTGGQFAGLAFAMLGISAAVGILVGAVTKLSTYFSDMIHGEAAPFALALAVIAVILTGMAFLTKIASSKDAKAANIGIIISLIVALEFVVSALERLSAIAGEKNGIEKLGSSALSIVGIFVVLAGVMIAAGKLVKDALGVAALMASLGVAVLGVAEGVSILHTSGANEIGAIVPILLLVAGLAAIMGVLAKFAPESGAIFAAIGGGFLGVGAGIFLLAAGIAFLMPLIDDIYNQRTTIRTKLKAVADIIAAVLVGFIASFLTALADETIYLVNAIGRLLLNIIVGVVNFLVNNAVTIGEAIGHFFAALVVVVIAALVVFCKDLVAALFAWWGIASPSKKMKEFGGYLIAGLVKGLSELGPVGEALSILCDCILSPLLEVATTILGGLEKILGNIIKYFKNWFGTLKNVMGDIISIIKNPLKLENWLQLGKDIVSGIANGLKSMLGVLEGAVQILSAPLKGLQTLADTALEHFLGSTEPTFISKDKKAKEYQKKVAEDLRNDDEFKRLINSYKSYAEDYNKIMSYGSKKVFVGREQLKDANGKPIMDGNHMPIYKDIYKTVYELTDNQKWQANQLVGKMKNIEQALEDYVGEALDYYENADPDVKNRMTALIIDDKTIAGSHGYMAGYLLGEELGDNVIKGIQKGMDEMYKVGDNSMRQFINGANNAAEIHSPSKVFQWIGQMIMAGFGIGIDDGTSSVNEIFATALNGIEDMAENATVTPVFDLSEIQNEADTAANTMAEMKTNIPQDVDLLNNTNAAKIDTLGESVDGLSSSMSTAMLEKIITDQNGIIMKLSDKLNQMGVYIDGKTLVGSVITDIDKGLGSRVGQIGRSVIG